MGAEVARISKTTLPAPAFWAALSFSFGIFISSLFTNNLLVWLAGVLGFGLFGIWFHVKQKNTPANLLFLSLCVCLGALGLAVETDVAPSRSVSNFSGLNKRLFLAGRICELPEVRARSTRLYLDKISVGWKEKIELNGKVLFSISRPISRFSLGDRINLVGFLDSLWAPANPGALDFSRYMRIRGVEGVVYLKDDRFVNIESRTNTSWRKKWEEVRLAVKERLGLGLPPATAGIVRGFVLGDTRQIEPQTFELFKKTGTLHLLAVSGANVAWVALLPLLLLKLFYLPLRTRYVAALFVVWIFVLLTDLQASVLRAAIMFTFWAASKVLYREVSGLQTLGLSGLFLLLIKPFWLFDIGFELSYLAAFALIFSFSENKDKSAIWIKRTFERAVWFNFRNSVAVLLLLTPLLAYYFNQVTWASLLVNVAAIPLAALITWSSILSLIFSTFGSGFLFIPVQIKLFSVLFAVQKFFAGLPHIFMRVPHPSAPETFLLTLAGLGLFLLFFKPQRRKAGLYLFLGSLALFVWGQAMKTKADIQLTVLEARGEAVAVLSSGDKTFVVGGGRLGGKTNSPERTLAPYLAYLGKSKIDGYFPLSFDSLAQTASARILELFSPELKGWPIGKKVAQDLQAVSLSKLDYLLAANDSVPFGLKILTDSLTFLFVPDGQKLFALKLDSLISGPVVLISPVDTTKAKILLQLPKVKAVVSTHSLFGRMPDSAADLFFTAKDGAVTFLKRKKNWKISTYLSKRHCVLFFADI